MLPEYEELVQRALVTHSKVIENRNTLELNKKQEHIEDLKEKLEARIVQVYDERANWNKEEEEYRRKRSVSTDTIFEQREYIKKLTASKRKLSKRNQELTQEYRFIPQKIVNYQTEIAELKHKLKKKRK